MIRRNTKIQIRTLIISTLTLILLVSGSVKAGIITECISLEEVEIKPITDPEAQIFVQVFHEDQSTNIFKIKLNPDKQHYLSRETQQWLFLRQCAHIKFRHQNIYAESDNLNKREEKVADCWAIKTMLENDIFEFSKRSISKIQRDIDELLRDPENWNRIFRGFRRQIDIPGCLQR